MWDKGWLPSGYCENHLKPLLKCQFPGTCPCRFSSFALDVEICALGQSPLRGIRFGKHCFIQCGQQATHSPQSSTHQGPHQLILGFPPVEPSCCLWILCNSV